MLTLGCPGSQLRFYLKLQVGVLSVVAVDINIVLLPVDDCVFSVVLLI